MMVVRVISMRSRWRRPSGARSPLHFGCTCSEARVMGSILTLPEDEIASILAGDPLEVRCDACGTIFDPTEGGR